MIGINKGPIVSDLRTDFYTARARVQPTSLAQAKGAGVLAVVFQNRLTNLDGTPNAIDLMIGTGGSGSGVWMLLPGQESPVIYTANLNDIWVSVRTGAVEVEFVYLCYRVAKPGE